jgi:DNA-binding MarR family transcriptional regulator
MKPDFEKTYENKREKLIQRIKETFHIEDTSGIELFGTLHRTAHISELLETQLSEGQDLSGPRWRLMLRLFMDENLGHSEGLTPTVLSKSQRVSKNTISALLRGLEEQGLIQRKLDPNDLRVFRILLTQAGRDLILTTAPRRLAGLNQLVAGLELDETKQLIRLLEKLQFSLMAQVQDSERGG